MSTLPTTIEILVGGTWTDITQDVYRRDGITITGGRSSAGAQVDTAQCRLTLKNKDGRYSPRNPNSPYYGLIGRNTQVRVSVSGSIRFSGEIASWPARWHPSGQDVWVPVQAAGILRRLGQGASPLQSPMRREFANPARSHIVAYWACEDGSAATQLASAVPGAPPLRIIRSGVTPAAATTWAASDALPTMGTGTLAAALPPYTVTGQTALRMFVQVPTTITATQRIVTLAGTGTASAWTVLVNTTGQLCLRAYEPDGTNVVDSGFATFSTFALGKPVSLGLELTQSGFANITWKLLAIDLAGSTLASAPLVFTTGGLAFHDVQRITQIRVGDDAGLGDTVVGHIAIGDDTGAYSSTLGGLIGWAGETAIARITRLCAEEQIPLTTYGVAAESAQVGPQRVAPALALLQSAADADGGVLHEQRTALGLAYRSLTATYNQAPTLTLDYRQPGLAPPLEPLEDDQATRNDITVQRDGGASARATLETGPLSAAAPPNGVGRYDDSRTLNLFTDDQAAQMAGWLLHLGTWDEARYPSVRVNLAKAPSLVAAATAVGIRDVLTITGLPPWMPPGDVVLLAEGYSETIGLTTWDIVFNASAAGPWSVGVADDPVYGRADTDGSQLAAGVTAAAASLSVATTAGPLWTTSAAEFPFDIRLGGEVMTVTNITGSTSPQTFSVTRAVNGVVKQQVSGADVRLAHPMYAAL